MKTLRSQKLRALLTHRKLLQSKAIAVENDLRGTNFGLKVGIVGKLKFEARDREPPRSGRLGRTATDRAQSAARTDRRPASPLAGRCPQHEPAGGIDKRLTQTGRLEKRTCAVQDRMSAKGQ